MNTLQNPEVYKCLAVSTVHVRPITMQWLEDHKSDCNDDYYDDDFDSPDPVIYQTMGGFLIPDTDIEFLIPDTDSNDHELDYVPEDLVKLMRFAAAEGYGMLWLDNDAKEYPELPQFRREWEQVFGQIHQ